MAKETNEILGHGAEADGIEEYDNPLPDWWVGLFLLTIVGGIGYGINYHFIAGNSQEGFYLAEMAAAEERWPTPEAPTSFEFDDAMVMEGETIYAQNCASCHNANLTGGIGANLVDEEWIHGSRPEEILHTITNGVAAKGMPAWGPILGPKRAQAVAAFVVSKKGSAPAVAADDGQGTEDGGKTGEDPAAVADAEAPLDGATIYLTNCAACHGPEMKGLVGPDLTDDEWIHGSDLESIKATITNGVPEKGMTSWGLILGEEKIDVVARYVQSKSAGEP